MLMCVCVCVQTRHNLILMFQRHLVEKLGKKDIFRDILRAEMPTGRRGGGGGVCVCVCTGVTLQQWVGLRLGSALNLTYIPRVTRHIALAQPGGAGWSRAEPGPPELPDTGWIRQAENGGALQLPKGWSGVGGWQACTLAPQHTHTHARPSFPLAPHFNPPITPITPIPSPPNPLQLTKQVFFRLLLG